MIDIPDETARSLTAEGQERKRRSMTWQSVQEEVLNRIQAGIWRPGQMIPTEAELATEFACARATINRALQALAATGMIERRRKVGTRVSSRPPVQMMRFLLRREIEAAGKSYRYESLDIRRAHPPADVARAMLLRKTDLLLLAWSRFRADEAPYCCEQRWINAAVAPGLDQQALERASACEWMLENLVIDRASMSMGATTADAGPVAAALELDPRDPVLLVERIDWTSNRAVSLTRRYFPRWHRLSAVI